MERKTQKLILVKLMFYYVSEEPEFYHVRKKMTYLVLPFLIIKWTYLSMKLHKYIKRSYLKLIKNLECCLEKCIQKHIFFQINVHIADTGKRIPMNEHKMYF